MTVCALFPGQGSQYIGMCSDLLNSEPEANRIFAEASEVLGYDLRTLIMEGALDQLTASVHAQPAVLTASCVLFDSFVRQTGNIPDYAIGHSLGEISALVAAGAIRFTDGVRFTAQRGALMHRAIREQKGRAGLVVDLAQVELEEMVETIRQTEYVTISGYNSPRQFVVAGTANALRLLDDKVDHCGGEFIPFRMMPMKADAPYHSELMQFIQPELEEMLAEIPFTSPSFPICSTVHGELIRGPEDIPKLLSNQLLQPIRWNQALTRVHQLGATVWVDIGPGETIRNMLAENTALPAAYSLDTPSDRSRLAELNEPKNQKYEGGEVG
ncbi:ACP S-malonyltransferase [Paenibacillus sp. PCH8]|uniref:ACP S-malonyltransferase n=1 Tax=Paenibacillus sp. PCH8 TaxID=2066524 RepID=UPI000CF9E8CD|nr:ACP S-malonyltransferase [Paenibacillus sp. PCH8]PQP85216.1 ACP S-malonyltransferase [Paenibacillus sp. PCH8]